MDDNREVIELINKLQDYQSTTGCKIKLELPQIVVVGAQSSGKSSVLDGLVGRSILPRGTGTVTKCPIIVQLFTIAEGEEEGVEFPDAPTLGRICDYDQVRKMIEERMEAGGGRITDTPVVVKVYSPKVVTLTVVDLPGIKKLPSAGEEDNQASLIQELSEKYISEKNAIILAVSPANYDICNSDGIVLAKAADPKGNRTIGVLTKLDLMDAGTDARSLLSNKSQDVTVKLGMIGLVNRSQKDIKKNLSVEEQLKKEKVFLEKTYPDLAHENGVPYLRKRLHELLVQHILKCLPDIKDEMERRLDECQERIEAIPEVGTSKDKFRFGDKIVQGFANCMKKEIVGSTRNPDYKHLYGGIKIKDIFENQFAEDMDNAAERNNNSITDDMILNAFRNSGGFDSFFVYPDAVFRTLAQEQIKQIEQPALKCAERVHEEILLIADRYLSDEDRRKALHLFTEFRRSLKSVVHNMLDDKLDSLRKQIKDYMRTQASVVFSLDKKFLEELSVVRRELEKNMHGEDAEDDSNPEEDCDRNDIDIILPRVPKSDPYSTSMRSIGRGASFKLNTDDNSLFAKLRRPQTIELIKRMAFLYFNHNKMQIQDYIPKLVADRLITQFIDDGESDSDTGLGLELRVHIMENYEKLLELPDGMSKTREVDVKLKEHLKEVILEIKGILNAHKYDQDEE